MTRKEVATQLKELEIWVHRIPIWRRMDPKTIDPVYIGDQELQELSNTTTLCHLF